MEESTAQEEAEGPGRGISVGYGGFSPGEVVIR